MRQGEELGALQRLFEFGDLAAGAGPGELGQDFGVAFPGEDFLLCLGTARGAMLELLGATSEVRLGRPLVEAGAMSSLMSDTRPVSHNRRRVGMIVGVAIAVVVSAALVLGFLIIREITRQVPQFPSLAKNPDTTLQGTVAYFADQTRCVKIVAAAGRPAKTVFCLPKMDVSKAVKEGKEIGPQLVWLPGGRLQVTMFRMTPPPKLGAAPGLHRGWQKIVDVRTGKIEDVPWADVPAQPNRQTHPMVSPSGQRISWTSDNGQVKVMLTDPNGSRTLLSVQGPGEYTYGLGAAFWAPNWQWIAADDGRILIITTGQSSMTRVLTGESSQGVFSAGLARFAVTGANILPPFR
jgi:hypothetical protein